MGGIRRRVSVVDVLDPGVVQDCGTIKAPALPLQESGVWKELAKVDCGSCTLSLRQGGSILPGLACLCIALCSKGPPDFELLLLKLSQVLSIGMDFVVTYDFRDCHPMPAFTQSLAKFWGEHVEQCSIRLKSSALLIEDTVFEMATQASIDSFVQACLLGRPFVICHEQATVDEFFKVDAAEMPPAREAAEAAPFLVVVDVQEVQEPSSPEPSCIVALAALGPCGGGPAALPDAPTFHALPNGDVRVIQSLPQDVVLQVGVLCQDSQGGQACTKAAVTVPGFGRPSGCAAPSAVAGLKIACPPERMQWIIGAHFHLGELAIDAELELDARECPEQSSSKQTGCEALGAESEPDCFSIIGWLLRKVSGWLLAVPKDQPLAGPHPAGRSQLRAALGPHL